MIIAVTNYKIFIYSFNNIKLKKTIDSDNDINGLCYIVKNNIIAYTNNEPGSIIINDIEKDEINVIKAHQNPIEKFCLSDDGNYIATCSLKGTLIRIFKIEENILLKELRRGSDQAKILDLKFNDDLSLLLCSSDKGTIHVFNALTDEENNNNTGFYGLDSIKGYLPQYFSSEWSFKQFYLPGVNTLSMFESDTKILSVGSDGSIYKLNFEGDKAEIENTIKYISNEDDPFSNRKSTIK